MIVYHGTTRDNAESIWREGFRTGTWFAFSREVARHYGPVVLQADIDPALLSNDVTDQFHTLMPLKAAGRGCVNGQS